MWDKPTSPSLVAIVFTLTTTINVAAIVEVIIMIDVIALEWPPVAFANRSLRWISPACRERPRLGGLTIKSNPSLRVVAGFEYLQAIADHGLLGRKQSPRLGVVKPVKTPVDDVTPVLGEPLLWCECEGDSHEILE